LNTKNKVFLFNYKWLLTKYYLDQNEEIKEVKIASWQHIPLINYENTNFYFLINTSFPINSNINSLLVSSAYNCSTSLYFEINDEKKLIPIQFNFRNNDNSFLNDFLYLRNSSFINFFINNLIDVPICFKKSQSLRTKNFELPILKFCTFLMKKGKKEKIFNILFKAFRIFFKNLKKNKILLNKKDLTWLNFFYFISNTMWNYNDNDLLKLNFNSDLNLNLSYDNILLNNEKMINNSFFLKNYLYFLISKISPVFSYFIYSVDKNIRKFSRGKSGKYTFIWKYVAPYKRTQLSMRWIVKDIKFFQSKKFQDRLINTFDNLMISPEKSFAWKSKIFSHNYVFKNFRKSLMNSLRTTT